ATATEQLLGDIWAQVLKVEATAISTAANFFELGGHSLLSVKLLSLIHLRFDKVLELSLLFSAPTIQAQAVLLDSLEAGLGNIPLLQKVKKRQKVNDCHAAKQAIILIPGVAGTANDFSDIAHTLKQSHVEDDVDIAIFRHRGLIAGEQYFDTIEDNVIAFADSLADLPYKTLTLVGHSYGGTLALALANYLKASDYQVRLVMLDTYFEQSAQAVDLALVSVDGLDIPDYLKRLYQHQANLFSQYQPLMAKRIPTTLILAKQHTFQEGNTFKDNALEQRRYKAYLADKLPAQTVDYSEVDGDHFSMLKGDSGRVIAGVIDGVVRSMNYEVFTLNQRPDLIEQVARLDEQSWPTFSQHSDAVSWVQVYDILSEYALVLTQNDTVIAVGFTVPVVWNQKPDGLPQSIESILQQGLALKKRSAQANTLIPIAALVDPKVQGVGLSSIVLKEMKKLAYGLGIKSLVVPVRPTSKSQYPMQSMSSYANRRREDGYFYDHWLRVHERLGAEIIHIAECTLTVRSDLSHWSKWTNMEFPESGSYVVPGALSTVDVDKDLNIAVYREPNVWMLHPM
ncbi:MAG: hypothetical protein HRT35_32180, partial [Algicola sp.]|nr:hypothetical protein [Algicola sp.]